MPQYYGVSSHISATTINDKRSFLLLRAFQSNVDGGQQHGGACYRCSIDRA